jgi:hypothetical protein
MLGEPGGLPRIPEIVWLRSGFLHADSLRGGPSGMPYKFALDRADYSDLASGKVFLSAPGHPAFPVRLASEVFQRCLAIRAADGLTGRLTLFDPCCGAAYHLVVLAFLHGESIREIVAADIDPQILPLAERNLSMLSLAGFDRRMIELAELRQRFGKASHTDALAAAGRMRKRLIRFSGRNAISVRSFPADALNGESVSRGLQGGRVDVVLTDVPYGRHSHWQTSSPGDRDPVRRLLDALRPSLHPGSVAAVISEKGKDAAHEDFQRIARLQIGKRQAVFLRLKRSAQIG